MVKKYIGLIFLGLVFFTGCNNSAKLNSVSNFTQQNPTNSTSNLQTKNTAEEPLKNENSTNFIAISNVDFISSKIGYISLSNSKNNNDTLDITYKLLKTQDGGHNWTSVGSNGLIEATYFVDDKLGFGKQPNNKITNGSPQNTWVKTVDGGLNWTPIHFIKDTNTLQLDVLNKNTMFICTVSNKNEKQPIQIYRTVSGAITWDSINLPVNIGFSEFGGMSWLSVREGYVLFENQPAAGNQPKTLYYTNNGGKTWSVKSKSDLNEINQQKVDNSIGIGGYSSGIKFFSNKTGYLGLTRGFVRKTTDGGITFKNITEYSDFNPLPDFINSEEGYEVFERNNLYHTTDGGRHWEKIISANNDLWNIIN